MTRRFVPPSPQKDKAGSYIKDPGPTLEQQADNSRTRNSLTLVEILERQMLALERTTIHLLKGSVDGLSKDGILSLATCMKLTLELREKELEILDGMNDAELEEAAKSNED